MAISYRSGARAAAQFLALALGVSLLSACPIASEFPDLPPLIDHPDAFIPATDNHPPALSRIGDRVGAVGQVLAIAVQAEDADGDALSYSVLGTLPTGATFDKSTHRFTWTPGPEAVSTTTALTFIVSDSQAIDRETVRITVNAAAIAHPPKFIPVGAVAIVAGTALSFDLEATDPDGDPLTFGTVGALPNGATLDSAKGRFQWTPALALAGSKHSVTFTVSDGALDDQMIATFVVQSPEGPGTGESAPVLTVPTTYEVEVGDVMMVTPKAVGADGDPVPIVLVDGAPAEALFEGGVFQFSPGTEHQNLAWSVLFSASDGDLTTFATMDLAVVPSPSETPCFPDAYEPNEETGLAPKLAADGLVAGSICDTPETPIDSDFYSIALEIGERLDVVLTGDPTLGDLDLFIMDSSGFALVSGESVGATESIEWTAKSPGPVFILVIGVGQPVFAAPYTLAITREKALQCGDGTCVADASPQANPAQAATLTAPDGITKGRTICCDTDWYLVDLEAGESVTVALTPASGAPAPELIIQNSDSLVVAQDLAQDTTALAAATADEAGTLWIEVRSPQAVTYDLEWIIDPAPPCTAWSCPIFTICDLDASACVDDLCEDAPCPTGYACIDAFCLAACDADSDCREAYACKGFETGPFCAVTGVAGPGEACATHEKCAGSMTCPWPELGGACTTLGCADGPFECEAGTACIDAGTATGLTASACAPQCSSPDECRVDDGFTCATATAEDLCLPSK